MEKHLHIVSFDIPFPPSYGGVIDVFFKLKALKAEGVKVHLHCFEYGRAHAKELDEFCESVRYYKRKNGARFLFTTEPYIASTRSSAELVDRLAKDDYPILFEGLHCCYHLADARLSRKKKIVRTHNIEHDYYRNLAEVERSVFKRWYFRREADKLEKFEHVLEKADHIIAISPADAGELSARYRHVSNVMAFHPDERVQVREGRGDFLLYHGNLAIGENNEAALFLVNKVFNHSKLPLVIAGNNPSGELAEAVRLHPNITLKNDIPTAEIYELIKNAQVNILPTFQATGIKLKLLAALFNGRHCLVNTPMVENTGLGKLCMVADEAEQMRAEAERLFAAEFSRGEKQRREEILLKGFSNRENVKKIIELI